MSSERSMTNCRKDNIAESIGFLSLKGRCEINKPK
jgi:hypothetical protein